jgi:hypothetical protein
MIKIKNNTKAVGIVLNTPIIQDKLLERFSLYKNTSAYALVNSSLEYVNGDFLASLWDLQEQQDLL